MAAGTAPEAPGERKITDINFISPGYLSTVGIPLKQGRDFSWGDHSGTPLVAIVNASWSTPASLAGSFTR